MSDVLQLHDVSVAERPPNEGGLCDVSLRLAPGDVCVLQIPVGTVLTPLADVASGLIDPDSGSVSFLGKSWSAYSARDAATARGRMGRVFVRADWLSNLDVDENITLSQRYHAHRAPEDALEEARSLARELGLGELPSGRPAFVDRARLLKAQWVRALMGAPALLLLDRPARELSLADSAPLIAKLQERRKRDGLAVLWITDSHERMDDSALRPTQKCAMEKGVLRPVELR